MSWILIIHGNESIVSKDKTEINTSMVDRGQNSFIHYTFIGLRRILTR